MPIPPIEGLGADERFDVGFVDSPQGYELVRKVLPGCEDCNRLNTTLYALNRCKVDTCMTSVASLSGRR